MDVSGIDLGSVNSVVVFTKEIINRSRPARLNHQIYGIPSILFSNENQVFVGEDAYYLAEDRPDLKVVYLGGYRSAGKQSILIRNKLQ